MIPEEIGSLTKLDFHRLPNTTGGLCWTDINAPLELSS